MKKNNELIGFSLDLKDKKLLLELFNKERPVKSAISKKIGVSQEVLAYRLKRLEDEGILKKIIPIIDYSALGYDIYRLQICFNIATSEQKEEFIEEIKAMPEIGWLVTLSGNWDMVMGFMIKKNSEFERIYNLLMDKYGKIIKDKQFTIVKSIDHLTPSYIYESERKIMTTGKINKELILEDNSKKILQEILSNGITTLTDVAKKLDVSVTTIRYHFNLLEKQNIIIGYRPIININKLGYEHFKVLIELDNPSDKKILKEIILQNKNAVYITEALGKYDLEFETEYKQTQELIEFIEQIKKTINIKSFEILFENKEIIINEVP